MKSVTDQIADRLEREARRRGMSTRHNWIGADGEEHGPIDPPDGDHCPKCGNGLEVSDTDIQSMDGEGEERAAFHCRACGAEGVRVRALVFSRWEDVEGGKSGKPGPLLLLPDPKPAPMGRRAGK